LVSVRLKNSARSFIKPSPEDLNSINIQMIDLIAMSGFSAQGANGLLQFLPFALILGIFYFMILLPMKKRQKKVQEFQDSLKVGDKVVTTSGIYGQITRLNDKSVQVQIADKVRIEVARAAVGGYQGQDPVVADSSN
jgi:preprotein translocase subunit YajC